MKYHFILALSLSVALSSCGTFLKPHEWPVEVKPDSESVHHMEDHVKFTGSSKKLTKQEQSLLTFLDKDDNIARCAGKKNRPGSHHWSAAEVYRVDPGKLISVLCEDGYLQTAVYFNYMPESKTRYRVSHLGESHHKGVPVVIVK